MKKENITKQALTEDQIERIKELSRKIRFGSRTLFFQDGILVQIDVNEKIRVRTE
ncbi:MAG: YezD family protein [Clostridia bacterium]|nr:YezD family protein [Clostridia bacterium]MBQ3379214.1 YezD family protein [Clostridia bacterium]